ncbi:MAG TPA: pilus assembly protein N-terminal domain-containing protein [Vicinamibacterales bacterium]|nr:pilus assembly protein N-terminal domain-containing protein [Vicinamibacterales bacterium]
MSRSTRLGALIFIIAILGSSLVTAAGPGASESVTLMVGRSTILDTGTPIARVSLTSADVADALVTSSNELLINGKAPGTISMFVWDRAGAIRRYEVVVTRDLARLGEQMHDLFPGESINVQSTGKHIVLSGTVSHSDMVEKAINVAAGYVDKKDDVVSLLQINEAATNQVLLRVRFAEVNRSALTELAANFFTSPNGEFHNAIGSTTTQQFAAPTFDTSGTGGNKVAFTDYLNFFLWDFKHDLGATVKALQTRGLLQSLAEPNLVAESGKEASFLAGGEFPVPIAQPNGGGVTVTVVYKEFGIRLNFTPTINGDRVHLKVRPEVSSIDFTNAVTLSGFRIPALSTRRTETELELQNGQTFAISGLLNNQVSKTMQKVPGIGDIPILGLLFRSESAQKDRTELVVMITPEILPRNSSGVTPNLPRLVEPYMAPLPQKKTFESPAPPFSSSSPMTAAPQAQTQPAAPQPPAQPAEASKFERPDPAAAATTMKSALAPMTTVMPMIEPTPAAPAQHEAAASEPPAPARPLTKKEQEAIVKARKQALVEEADRNAKQSDIDKRAAEKAKADQEKQKKEQDKQAREQAKRDAAAAKKQAELDKKQAIADAEAQLKAAQAAVDAAKTKKP